MIRRSLANVFIVGACLLEFLALSSASTRGVVSLDSLVFDKVVGRFPAVLVKIDVQYPYGDKHEAFKTVAADLAATPELLVAEVGVQDYGENENQDIAERYNLKKDDFPALLLFKDGNAKPSVYPVADEFTTDKIKSFLRKEADVRLLLDKCIKEFDEIAEQFMAATEKDAQQKLLKRANELLSGLEEENEKKSGDVYIKLMQKVVERGNKFVESENERVKNLLAGKISDTKRAELKTRANILQSFLTSEVTGKEEL